MATSREYIVTIKNGANRKNIKLNAWNEKYASEIIEIDGWIAKGYVIESIEATGKSFEMGENYDPRFDI